MAYTYRLSKRLAQIHIFAAVLIVSACSDTQAPTQEYSINSPSLAAVTLSNSNEPTGFTMFSDRPFNAKVENGWTDRGDAAFTIVSQSSAPKSPNPIGQALFKTGFKGGSGPIALDLSLRNAKKKELYVSFWVKFSSNFYGSMTSGVNKVYHVWINGVSKVVFAAFGHGTGGLMPQLRLQNFRSDPRGVSFNLNPTLTPNVRFARGQWYHVELVLKANTPGVADGTVKWWINGVMAGSDSKLGPVGAAEQPYWEQLSWAPTWGGPAETVPASMYMYMDHVYVSRR